jgi:uncharacterized Zn finger protein
MPRESVETKGRRYLLEGRLTVIAVDESIVRATCRGAGALYQLGFDGEAWSCSCPAVGRCAHLVAVQLVTVRGQVDDPEPVAGQPRSTGAAVEDDDGDGDPEPVAL